MLLVTEISDRIHRPYKETVLSGTVRSEEWAPVLASFDLTLATVTRSVTDWAEVRKGPHGPQIDFSDSLQSLLIENGASSEAWHNINALIYDQYCGVRVDLPKELPHAT